MSLLWDWFSHITNSFSIQFSDFNISLGRHLNLAHHDRRQSLRSNHSFLNLFDQYISLSQSFLLLSLISQFFVLSENFSFQNSLLLHFFCRLHEFDLFFLLLLLFNFGFDLIENTALFGKLLLFRDSLHVEKLVSFGIEFNIIVSTWSSISIELVKMVAMVMLMMGGKLDGGGVLN